MDLPFLVLQLQTVISVITHFCCQFWPQLQIDINLFQCPIESYICDQIWHSKCSKNFWPPPCPLILIITKIIIIGWLVSDLHSLSFPKTVRNPPSTFQGPFPSPPPKKAGGGGGELNVSYCVTPCVTTFPVPLWSLVTEHRNQERETENNQALLVNSRFGARPMCTETPEKVIIRLVKL